MQVHGKTTDDATRCVHYHSQQDIVAIKFKCCGRFYPCFQCHAECETHPAQRWPETEWSEKAILCGECRTEMTITDYRQSTHCANCGAEFNEGCRLHAHLYFHESEQVTTIKSPQN